MMDGPHLADAKITHCNFTLINFQKINFGICLFHINLTLKVATLTYIVREGMRESSIGNGRTPRLKSHLGLPSIVSNQVLEGQGLSYPSVTLFQSPWPSKQLDLQA